MQSMDEFVIQPCHLICTMFSEVRLGSQFCFNFKIKIVFPSNLKVLSLNFLPSIMLSEQKEP